MLHTKFQVYESSSSEQFFFYIFSSPELAQDELLGYRDVRRTCGRPLCLRRTRRPSVNFLACVHSRGNSFDPKMHETLSEC